MKTRIQPKHQQGYALLLTLVFVSITLLLVASMGQWAANSSSITARNNLYNSTVSAAEAATEVVIAQMNRDFQHQALSANVDQYSSLTPAGFGPNGLTKDYLYSDGRGHTDRTDIACKGWQSWTNLNSEFAGLYGMINSYEITSNARRITGPYSVAAGVRQSVEFTSIPLFQYAIFYTLDLEINPGPPMLVTGKTHGNADIYVAPGDTLEFLDTVTAVGHIIHHRHANDPTDPDGSSRKEPIYSSKPQEQVSSITLPVGTNNNPANVVQILDVPPPGEHPYSDMGQQRLHNKSDLVITIAKDSVQVKYNNNGDGARYSIVPTNSPANGGYSFVKTNGSFFDFREGKQIMATEIDIKALKDWIATAPGFNFNLLAQAQMGHPINSIYVNDERLVQDKLTAVRVINGESLPVAGLTVATPQPLYVKGNFNAPDLTPGQTNTLSTKPAAFASDAITILSTNWNDNWNASTGLGVRDAVNTTVNAAFLGGIVETAEVDGRKHFSGGVENFPRFLEDWSGRTLTYNGSMVVMFASRHAKSHWIAPGTYYNPPVRKWAFDRNFLDANKLPPNTPQARYLHRRQWSVVAATDK